MNAIETVYKSLAEHQRVYDLIWSQTPEMQNRTSSSWWFFLLFPKQPEGYGPRQMMFTIATRAGEKIRISDEWLAGLDTKRTVPDGEDTFEAISVGWYFDGETLHEDVVKETAVTRMSLKDRTIHCWADNGNGYQINDVPDKTLTMAAHIKGAKGEAQFEAWGDLNCLDSSPHESINVDTPVGGTHFIAWRRMNFKGEFDLPVTGKETLEGIGYFQRVCMHVPLFPWKWLWMVFPDGSMFSAYVPYIGLNMRRKEYGFFASERKERAVINISGKAFWDWNDASERTWLKNCKVTIGLNGDKYPHFEVRAQNKQGDFVNFTAVPYERGEFFIDRPILGGRVETHWHYNEFLIRAENLSGSIQGKAITKETMGQAFGSLEYTYGLGL